MELYFKNERLSQSKLKKILISPHSFLRSTNEEEDDDDKPGKLPKECLLIGNAVDCLITEEGAFAEKFKVLDNVVETPVGKYKDFIDNLFLTKQDIHKEINSITEEEWYLNAHTKVDAKAKNMALEVFVERFIAGDGKPYYDYLAECQLKQTLTVEQWEKTQRIVESLKTHMFTRDYFNLDEEEEAIYQLELFWDFEGVEMKSKLDIVIINHNLKTITPIDLKTSENNRKRKFMETFFRNRYDFQGACYNYALEQWRKDKYPNYVLEPFLFIVESTKYIGNPRIYELGPETEQIGLRGGKYEGTKYEGFVDAIERYKFHTDSNLWEYDMEEYQSEGLIQI
jgi:hypothetical protein